MSSQKIEADVQAARVAGEKFGEERNQHAQLQPYASRQWLGQGSQTTLHLDDFSAIPFLVDIAGAEEYQHRARVRAADGDVVATSTPTVPGYEDYCRAALGMGAPEHIVADPVGQALRVAHACRSGSAFSKLVDTVKRGGGLTIHPYMGIEEVWELAADLEKAADCPVRVIGPPPPATWIANDKAAFDELVKRVLGAEWIVENQVQRDPLQMTSSLLDLATRYRQVGLKRTRCASAMGNEVFLSSELTSSPAMAQERVFAFLNRTEWPEGEEVLSVAWLDTDLSPSTQLWIPPLGQEEPRLDGIYEQILADERKVFVGSRPSTLPPSVNERLGAAALRVAAALQALGYVGRCSFDHLVTGNPEGDFEVLFTECNGRWGGTSTPMSLLDRLYGGPRPPYRAQDVVYSGLIGSRMDNLLEPVSDLLFDVETRKGRFIFYNLGPMPKHGKFDVISIGENQEEAERGVLEILPKRLGL